MKYIHVYALLLMPVFLSSCVQNQTSEPKGKITAIGSEINDIGPNMMVRNIKKGSKGTILLAGPNNASSGDVFRYDPSAAPGTFTNLTSKIGPHQFWDALEDRRGNMWFATTDSGVYNLPAGQTRIQHFTTRNGLASNRVMSVYEDKAGIIWFGTGSGISRYDPSAAVRTGQAGFQTFKNPNPSRLYKGGDWSNDITTILEDKTGKLWVGTRGDAFVYDARLNDGVGQGKSFTTLTQKDRTFTNVWSIIEDRKGNIWLGDVTNGLWRYDPSSERRAGQGTFTKVSEKGTYAIIEDKKGNIWTTGPVNTAHVAVWALSRYDAKSLYSNKPTVTEVMTGDAFLGLLEADDGSIWFGSATGVYRYDARLPDGQGKITDFYNKEGQKKYRLDTKQSVVIWKGSSLLGDGTSTGDVDILKGELLVENRRLAGGAVEVNMNTIEQKFDEPGPHNQLPPFFDVKKFPVSKFAITKVETLNDGKIGGNGNMTIEAVMNIKVTGNLTMEGITKAVTFPAQMYFKDGMDGTVVLNGALIVDRTEWGIDYMSEKYFDKFGGGTISDEVRILVKIVGKKSGR